MRPYFCPLSKCDKLIRFTAFAALVSGFISNCRRRQIPSLRSAVRLSPLSRSFSLFLLFLWLSRSLARSLRWGSGSRSFAILRSFNCSLRSLWRRGGVVFPPPPPLAPPRTPLSVHGSPFRSPKRYLIGGEHRGAHPFSALALRARLRSKLASGLACGLARFRRAAYLSRVPRSLRYLRSPLGRGAHNAPPFLKLNWLLACQGYNKRVKRALDTCGGHFNKV